MNEQVQRTPRPVTTVFTWEVRPGEDAAFERWAHGLQADAETFPGNQGVTWLRPEGGSRRYHAVVRWSGPDSLDRWMASPERAARYEQVSAFGRTAHPQLTTTGLETWFNIPRMVTRPPARWKMSLVTLVAVYPFALLYNEVFARYFETWQPAEATVIFPVFLSPLLTYAIMPGLSRVLRRWLYGEQAAE